MPLCSAVYVAKIPSLFFISSPLGTSLQIVLVLEPAPCRTFCINNHKGILNPSNKFRTGIFLCLAGRPWKPQAAEGNFRSITLSKVIPPSHLCTQLLFPYPALPSGSSLRPPADSSISRWETWSCFAFSGLRSARVVCGTLVANSVTLAEETGQQVLPLPLSHRYVSTWELGDKPFELIFLSQVLCWPPRPGAVVLGGRWTNLSVALWFSRGVIERSQFFP